MRYERNISYDIFFFFLNIAIINYIYICHTFDKKFSSLPWISLILQLNIVNNKSYQNLLLILRVRLILYN